MNPPPDIRIDPRRDDLSVLPARHGVLRLSASGETAALLCAADVRGLAVERLAGGPAGACDEAAVWLAGSSFEADLRFLTVAAAHAPEVHRVASARLGVWWLAVDPERPGDGWSLTDLAGAVPTGRITGPFLDRSTARRWAAMLDSEFELCREPGQLRRAPRGTPCIYKQMGRCPAACDGSEPLRAYLARLEQALALTVGSLGPRRSDLESRIEGASGAADFERAGALRDRLVVLPTAEDRAAAMVGPIGAFSFVAVGPGIGRGRVRLLACGVRGWGVLAEVEAGTVTAGELSVLTGEGVADERVFEPAAAGVVARELARPRRGGPILLRRHGLNSDELLPAVRAIGKIDTRRKGAADA